MNSFLMGAFCEKGRNERPVLASGGETHHHSMKQLRRGRCDALETHRVAIFATGVPTRSPSQRTSQKS
jgi:hypothetical protein